jgi:hypothetical protein
LPRVAELPAGWRHFSPAEKVKHFLGMSLDRAAEILTWRLADLDELQLTLWALLLDGLFCFSSGHFSGSLPPCAPAKLNCRASFGENRGAREGWPKIGDRPRKLCATPHLLVGIGKDIGCVLELPTSPPPFLHERRDRGPLSPSGRMARLVAE